MLNYRRCLVMVIVLLASAAAADPPEPLLSQLVFWSGRLTPVPSAEPGYGVDDSGVPALTSPAGRRLTASFLGRPIDASLIEAIEADLRGFYAGLGRPFVEIDIAAQTTLSGTLAVRVTEASFGAIRVEGNRWFGDQQYLAAVQHRTGDPIDLSRLSADTDWLNRDPHRQVKLLIGPGQQPGTYDLTIHAEDSVPLAVTLTADNTGTNETGLYRIGVGLDWSNALWRGDDLHYDFVTSPDGSGLQQHVLSYTAYLPSRDAITVTGMTAASRARIADGLASASGRAGMVSLRYAMWFSRQAAFSQHLDLGGDFKTTNSNVLTGGAQVFRASAAIDQAVIGYTLEANDERAATSLVVTLAGSPGSLSPGNTMSAFAAQQPGATPDYIYGRLAVERVTSLLGGAAWDTKVTMQISNANLLPTEQLMFSGVQSVRGFVEQGALRDQGVLAQNELRGPPIQSWFLDNPGLVPFVFLDQGVGRNVRDIAGNRDSWLELVSIGPGLSWQLSPAASFRFSWAVPLIRNGHAGPLLEPQFGTQISF